MQYREFGNTGIMVSAMGMGANRFKKSDLETDAGIERCAEIVVNAANYGVNFFDSAQTYSFGKCEQILKLALPQIKSKCYICGKSSSYQERTKDSLLRYIDTSLDNIGIDYFDFYYMWSVKSLSQYHQIMSSGGAYEGALAAKERGLIKHICFSTHASAIDTVKIIEDGAFEGVLVSYSLLNFRENAIVLETAQVHNMGVAVMNPLGGGIIPQNAEMFSGAMQDGDKNIVEAAMKFVYSNEAVSTVLSGISDNDELVSNVQIFSEKDSSAELRYSSVIEKLGTFSGFCTGCDYCTGCPLGIPVSTLMTAYNQTKFKADAFVYNRTSLELIKRGNFFKKLEGVLEFENSVNPCVKCGKCEKICTQSLPIINNIAEIYQWVEENCVSTAARRERVESLIQKDYRRVGMYTAGVYTSNVYMQYISKLFEENDFELFVFDSNSTKWGNVYLENIIVRNPAEIPQLNLDILLITNYIHSDNIYDELSKCFSKVNIQKLHKDNDLPWFY